MVPIAVVSHYLSVVKLYSETYLQQNHKGLELFPIAGRFCLTEVLAV